MNQVLLENVLLCCWCLLCSFCHCWMNFLYLISLFSIISHFMTSHLTITQHKQKLFFEFFLHDTNSLLEITMNNEIKVIK